MEKLFVIAGHGAGDPGAVGGGLTEADLVRQLAARLKDLGGDAVTVGDTSVNWYKSDYISKGKCPDNVPVIELHMDSSNSPSAKGGHVIIKSGYSADAYDTALADFISGFFPGRSQAIVGRSDLANVNRSAKMGVNYRLVENGFISNYGDREKFVGQMDDLARGILTAFGITAAPTQPTEPEKPAAELPEALRGYTDVDPEAWYVDDLARAVERGIISGYGDGRIGPNDYLTRGQAVCVIARMVGADLSSPYSDVVATPYYYEAVEWAKRKGIVSSESDTFRPDDACTRAELATMFHRSKGSPEATKSPTGYTDWADVPEWAVTPMAWAVEVGVIVGSGGKLRPNDACTRAEAAAMALRL